SFFGVRSISNSGKSASQPHFFALPSAALICRRSLFTVAGETKSPPFFPRSWRRLAAKESIVSAVIAMSRPGFAGRLARRQGGPPGFGEPLEMCQGGLCLVLAAGRLSSEQGLPVAVEEFLPRAAGLHLVGAGHQFRFDLPLALLGLAVARRARAARLGFASPP